MYADKRNITFFNISASAVLKTYFCSFELSESANVLIQSTVLLLSSFKILRYQHRHFYRKFLSSPCHHEIELILQKKL